MHERVRLLLTTDLLAEGVNLQDAGVVVHLDQPWTPAAIAQREGRITRLGSEHAEVHAYTLRPPGGGAALLAIAARLRRKARAAMLVLAPDATPAPTLHLVTDATSPLQRWLQEWASIEPAVVASIDTAGTVILHDAPRAGWLAAVFDGTAWSLCGGWFLGRERRTRASRDSRVLRALVEQVHTMLPLHEARSTRRAIPAAYGQAERTVRVVLRRRRVRARAHAVIDVLQSPPHLAARLLRDLTSHATLRDRLTLTPLVAHAARTLRTLRGAGEEHALTALLAPTVAPAPGAAVDLVASWLHEVIALGAGAGATSAEASHDDPAPTLLLLLP